jgi:O-antigen ligase
MKAEAGIMWRIGERGGIAAIALCFLAFVFLTGGASRADAQSQILVRLASILVCAVAFTGLTREDVRRVRAPLMFLGLAAMLMVIQMVPMPPAFWLALPGRDRFSSLLELALVGASWRPLSLTPDLTLNSLLALLPALAVMLIAARLPSQAMRGLLVPVLVLILISGLLGLLQLSSGAGDFYLYRVTNSGEAVGLFANRNHQGFLLALALPMLAVFAARQTRAKGDWNFWLAVGLVVFIFPLILVTGSRAALVLALVGCATGWLLLGPFKPTRGSVGTAHGGRLLSAALWVGGIALVGIAAFSARAVSIQRLFSEDVSQEIRLRLFRPMLDLALTYFPVGSGFGSFVDIFKMHEPLSNLSGTYLNHAHNDLLELLIEGGLPGLLLLAAFGFWYSRGTIQAWKSGSRDDCKLFARLGSVVIAMLMLASLADYPLRTPIFLTIFALALCWLAPVDRKSRPSRKPFAQLYPSTPSD